MIRSTHLAQSLVIGLLASMPVAAEERPSIEALQAKIEAQDARIRELEAAVRRLSVATSAPASKPPAAIAVVARPAPAAPTVKLRGRLQVDALALNQGDGTTPTGTQVRRFYLGAEGQLGGGFRYLADVDVAGNRVSLQDAFIAYRASPRDELALGYFKPPAVNDELTSDVTTLFLERSAYSSVFAPGRRIGVALGHADADWGVRAGLFGERDDGSLDGDRNEGWLAAARTHVDLLPGDEVLHIALSAYYTDPSGVDETVRLRPRPEANRAAPILDVGPFAVDDAAFAGGELALAHGAWTLQAEGGSLHRWGAGADRDHWGFSSQLAWRLTGEARPYDATNGLFGRVTPAAPLGSGGPGAFELGLRVTYVDLADAAIQGGKLTTYGTVLNWYPEARVRLSANFIHARARRSLEPDMEQNLIALRAAVDW